MDRLSSPPPARGTVELADAGEWSFAFHESPDPEPHQLPLDRPIPLIRANPVGNVIQPYRFAEPQELHQTHPSSQYSILQSTSAQRLLIPRPELHLNEPVVHPGAPMLFADMYTLAAGTALFPDPSFASRCLRGRTCASPAERRCGSKFLSSRASRLTNSQPAKRSGLYPKFRPYASDRVSSRARP